VASSVPSVQTTTRLVDAAFLRLAPLDAGEITLSSRLWEMVLALGVSDRFNELVDVLEISEDDALARLETLEALGVIESNHELDPEPIAPGALATLVDGGEVDIDVDEYHRERAVPYSLDDSVAPADLVEHEHDDDSTRALIFRFLGSFED
jgi:hypothetical protein